MRNARRIEKNMAPAPTTKTIAIAPKGISGLLAMMSPSPALAAVIFGWANVGLIASLAVGVVSTVLIVWMGNIKEDDLKLKLAAAMTGAAKANEGLAKANAGIANANAKAAEANEHAEQLRNANLALEKQLLALQKNVRGREITDAQHDEVIRRAKGKKIPELITYIARDPEARFFGFSIISVFQELGMKGKVVLLDDAPPMQTGVMYCGRGTNEDIEFMKILMDANIVGVGNAGGKFGHDATGKDIIAPYCPPGSLFVGTRNPLQEIRTPKRSARKSA